jgi:RNA polymerase sigma factor (sigma-70 family)
MTLHPATRELFESYCATLAGVRSAARRASSEDRAFDRAQLSSMAFDLEWAIEYMVTGFPPESGSGPYHRTLPVDPQRVLQQLAAANPARRLMPVERTRRLVLAALDILSPTERDCYLMIIGEGLSYGEVARMLRVSKSTVQTHMSRAKTKVARRRREDAARLSYGVRI